MNSRDVMKKLMQESYTWILHERSTRLVSAKRISREDREALEGYFSSGVLNRARVALVDQLQNPPFYPRLRGSGVHGLIDFNKMAGITFVDCILMTIETFDRVEDRIPILFHEMVHVVQYLFLGARRFIEMYLTGWYANNSDYFRIPLEKQAYDLQRRFENGERFSVELKLGIIVL